MKLHKLILLFSMAIYSFAANAITLQSTLDETTALKFAHIPAGAFYMGTKDIEKAAAEMPKPDISDIRDETPLHRVRFNQSFLLSTTEVTQSLWLKTMNNKPRMTNIFCKSS